MLSAGEKGWKKSVERFPKEFDGMNDLHHKQRTICLQGSGGVSMEEGGGEIDGTG